MGNPDVESTNGRLADAYERGAKNGGHEVRRMNLGEMKFDPILHRGYKVRQELEPDLIAVQENIKWADHFVLIYPSWWSGMPGPLKGMFDRMWLPGFAFNFSPGKLLWKMLLKGKTARVIVTSDTNPLINRFMFGDSTGIIQRGILWFSGIFPVYITRIGGMKSITEEKRLRWIGRIERKGGMGR
jgi:putative NADPH-quinone reductase